jgi:hypothetical protein
MVQQFGSEEIPVFVGSRPCRDFSSGYGKGSVENQDCLLRLRCVFFVSFVVRRGSISPTCSTFLEAVHAGLLIIKLLWRLQLVTLQPNREP